MPEHLQLLQSTEIAGSKFLMLLMSFDVKQLNPEVWRLRLHEIKPDHPLVQARILSTSTPKDFLGDKTSQLKLPPHANVRRDVAA